MNAEKRIVRAEMWVKGTKRGWEMATKLKPILKKPNRNLSFNPSKNRNNRRQ